MEKCTIHLDEGEQRLIFEILCKHGKISNSSPYETLGIQKIYKLAVEDCDSLQAVYSKDEHLNRIVSSPKKLIDSINNFHTQLDEISLVATRESIKLKSYIDDTKGISIPFTLTL
jgi:cell cycle checkpoint control protein RAD9A